MGKNEIIKILEGIRDERTKGANTARRVGNSLLSMFDFLLSADREKLSSSSDDIAQGIITFAKGLISDNVASLKGGATFGPNGIFHLDKDGNLVVDTIKSTDFSEILQKGFGIEKSSDKFTMYLSNLVVWGKAIFNDLEIRKLYSVGGNVYLSGSSSKIHYVKEVRTAEKNGTLGDLIGWQCYILADDGTTATQNTWTKYDQAKCQTFNIQSGTYRGVENKFYWRLVTAVSASAEVIKDEEGNTLFEGKKFSWIILSATDCESPENDAPAAGDIIVLDGHRMAAIDSEDAKYNDTGRANVMTLETTGAGTPRIVGYRGITDFTHKDKDVFVLSPDGTRFKSSFFKWVSSSGEAMHMVNYRGEWQKGLSYNYYDQVSHGNGVWLCTNPEGSTSEPMPGSADWQLVMSAQKGEKGEDGVAYQIMITSDTGTVMINGSGEMTLKATLLRNGEDISDTVSNSSWSWWRQSADAEDDDVWNTLHEGVGRNCLITRDDVDRQAQFGCSVCISDTKTINSNI